MAPRPRPQTRRPVRFARALLILSILANVTFTAWWFTRATFAGPVASVLKSPEAPPASSPKAASSTADTTVSIETWAKLAVDSDQDYATNLRAAGFPPNLVRALLTARIRARYREKLESLRRDSARVYWRSEDYVDRGGAAETAKQRRAVLAQINTELKSAMGTDYESLEGWDRAQRTKTYGALPREKTEALTALIADYKELERQIYDQQRMLALPEDRAQLALLNEEKRADLDALLTPAEQREYELRSSQSAVNTRYKLKHFEPTEEEFRLLASIQIESDQSLETVRLLAENPGEIYQEAQSRVETQMLAALSPERAEEFKLTANETYDNTVYFLKRFNYEPALARELVTAQRAIEQRAAALRSQPQLSETQRAAELAALYREAKGKLANHLGPAALATYEKQSSTGGWLKKLQPIASASGGGTP